MYTEKKIIKMRLKTDPIENITINFPIQEIMKIEEITTKIIFKINVCNIPTRIRTEEQVITTVMDTIIIDIIVPIITITLLRMSVITRPRNIQI
jgi:hypothetical protein